MRRKKRVKAPTAKARAAYRALWLVVDGAVANAFDAHPNYLAPDVFPKAVRNSINKRVVGAVLASAEQAGSPKPTRG